MTANRAENASAWVNKSAQSARLRSGSVAAVAASSADVSTVEFRPFVEQKPSWATAVAERINSFHVAGVDVASDVILQAWPVLMDPIFAGTPQPMVSPVEDGGLTAEFRSVGVELQIEFMATGEIEAYVLQPGVFEWEGPLADLPDGLTKWTWRLAHPGV